MTSGDWSGLAFDSDGRLMDLNGTAEVMTFGPPPPTRWVVAGDLASVFGRRACLVRRSGPVYDVRCASEVFGDSGGLYVNLVHEDQWYRWLELAEAARPERVPHATCVGARHVWIELNDYQSTPLVHSSFDESSAE